MESGPGDIYEQEADRAADQVLKARQRYSTSDPTAKAN
jgi:hypothetical protein